jgi:hypothetical protein
MNSPKFYAKTYVDGNKHQSFSDIDIYESLLHVVATLYNSGLFAILKNSSTKSTFPFRGVDPGEVPLYFLHIECGKVNNTLNLMYSRTEFCENGLSTEYIAQGALISDSSRKLIKSLNRMSVLENLKFKANSSVFPFGTSPTPNDSIKSSSARKTSKEVKRQLPSQVIGISHPDCQNVCTSFEHFKTTKCKSICAWRTEL